MMVDYLYPFIKADLYIMQSLYDSWVGANVLGLNCVAAGL
jgi:hypothetical protein